MNTLLKVALVIVGIPAGIFFVVFVYFLFNPDNEPLTDKVARECRREYGSRGEEAVDQCRVNTLTRYLLEAERRKERAVYDRVR